MDPHLSPFWQDLARVALIGIGATALMDLWLVLLKRLGLPGLHFGHLGRWAGHVARGRWVHAAMAKAAPVRGELALGFGVHYAVGIAFAAVLVVWCGMGWAHRPSLAPALALGVGSVVMPLFVMQPAMGAGVASSKTPTPLRNCLKSLANHTVFGAGLYLAAIVLACVWP
jgi:hypothetical protein